MKKEYSGSTLEECLAKAEENLSIPRTEIDYDIIKEERGFFKKYYEILVKNEVIKEVEKPIENVFIEADRIRIEMPEDRELDLEFDEDIKIIVNEKEVKSLTKVTSLDIIRYECNGEIAKRELTVKLGDDKLSAMVSVEYTPEKLPEITCKILGNKLKIIKSTIDGALPLPYNKDDIIEALNKQGIVYGILKEEIEDILKKDIIDEVVVARGVAPIDDEDDRIEVYFEGSRRTVSEDSSERIDYRNLYSIANVFPEDLLAELKLGREGKEGIDIFGKVVSKRCKKTVKLKAGDGCRIVGNKVLSNIEGRPTMKGGVFYVNKVLQTSSDVDIKSGNIRFVGDVQIDGNIRTGMLVEAGNSVEVKGNVESGRIIAQGEVRISGSVINSILIVGAKDLDKQYYLETLESFKKDIEELLKSVEQIKDGNFLGNRSEGEVIKLLIETKFKGIPRKALVILSIEKENQELIRFIKEKIIGNMPLNIKFSNELYDLIKYIEKEIEEINKERFIPVDVKMKYCQDSQVQSTGNIFITGKGQYISELTAKGDIEFLESGAVSRGGTLIAGGNIKAKVIGSIAGVTTILKVPKDGIITADIAYPNSLFYFGERQYNLEFASKDVKGYLDEKGEIVVEKILL
ncbi:flagellar assembly protein A [Clostridium paraputrificum]|uniref:flagellar assembly protein A n=1 Tax=Clostridium TaxID=1485 RepID=UPI003D32E2BE